MIQFGQVDSHPGAGVCVCVCLNVFKGVEIMQVQMSEKDEPNSKQEGGKLTALADKKASKALHDLPASFVSSLYSSQPQNQYCERKTRSLI